MAVARRAVDMLRAEPLAELSPGGLGDRVRELAGLVERVEAELVRTVGQWDAVEGWASDDPPRLSARAWLADNAALSGARASRLVRTARLAHSHDATGEALAAGEVSVGHVEQLALVVTDERAGLYPDHEATLLGNAKRLSVDWYARALRHWKHLADDALDSGDPFAVYQRRRFHLSDTTDASVMDGRLDLEAGALLRAALEAAEEPDPDNAATKRTGAQRRADALVELARAYLAGEHGQSHAEILFHVDPATYLGITGSHALAGASPLLAPDTSASADHAPAGPSRPIRAPESISALDGYGPVPPETVRRACCDGALRRAIVDARGEILDLGRRVRLASPAQRRAVTVRDHHCVFPGCTRPARWCDVHHIARWEDGGATNLDNLCLLCRHHHVLVHEGHWQLQRQGSTWTATHPQAQPNTRTNTHDPPTSHAA